uniref:Uncharacterized protein n=1 Tax=Lactuca sativa TaxID=4236 RepID=A0A9R1VZR3_LACSA|nr:hypothetical protein LSAT_V11C400211600 [Lactuca sativa]
MGCVITLALQESAQLYLVCMWLLFGNFFSVTKSNLDFGNKDCQVDSYNRKHDAQLYLVRCYNRELNVIDSYNIKLALYSDECIVE